MPLDKIGKQLMLKGMRALRGAERVEGKPGLWRIEPEKLSENKWLTRANKRMLDEGDLAEFNGNLNGLRSISGKERAKHAYMTSGALNTLRTNSEPWSRDDAVRGLVHVDKNGNVIGATAVDQRKGAELLGDLDMTRRPPGYLEYIGTVAPEARGLDLMQQTQDWLGNDLLFQAASPKKNVPLYQSWGARLAPEIEGGVPELPYMRLLQRAERQAEENPKQLRLEGFAGGGSALKALKKLFHGGTYTPGDAIRRVLYAAPDKNMAKTYVDMYNDRYGDGARLIEFQAEANNAAPLDVVRRSAMKYGIPFDDYTPASAFDANLHGHGSVEQLLSELRAGGYDHSVLEDMPYGYGHGGAGDIDPTAVILFENARTLKK